MAIDLFCYVSTSTKEVNNILLKLRNHSSGLFESKFIIYDARSTGPVHKEIALEYSLHAHCIFVVSLNDKKSADRISEVVEIIKNSFGDKDLIILFNNETLR